MTIEWIIISILFITANTYFSYMAGQKEGYFLGGTVILSSLESSNIIEISENGDISAKK
jgi:hypothetical protein